MNYINENKKIRHLEESIRELEIWEENKIKEWKRSLLLEGKMIQDIDEWNSLVEERNDLLEENKKLKEENEQLRTRIDTMQEFIDYSEGVVQNAIGMLYEEGGADKALDYLENYYVVGDERQYEEMERLP